jgi:hypothetical protein
MKWTPRTSGVSSVEAEDLFQPADRWQISPASPPMTTAAYVSTNPAQGVMVASPAGPFLVSKPAITCR